MFPFPCNKKGLSLIEVTIALFVVTIGILGLLSMQPTAWRLTGSSDHLGRASGILNRALESSRVFLLNENNPNPCAANNPSITTQTIYPSGQVAGIRGDVPFTVQTTTTDLGNNTWTVRVTVTWPGTTNGISDTIRVGRQLSFLWPPL